MILGILILMVILYGIFHLLVMAGFPPHPIYAVIGFLNGAFKALKHWLVGVSILAVIGFVLFIFAIDIVTPPYILGTETLFAIPLGIVIENHTGLSAGWAFGIAYGIIFILAVGYLVYYLYLRRKK